jgi:23S rRNA (cytosine1962-C5)-methyltransferase
MLPQIKDPLAQVEQSYQIIYQNEHYVIIDKPAGYLSHPDGQSDRLDIYRLLTDDLKKQGLLKDQPLGLHQRLDVGTSGVMAFSLSPQGAKSIEKALKEGQKKYLAVVDGIVSKKQGTINSPIPTAPQATAITHYQVLKTDQQFPSHPYSLLLINPITGKTHQIRYHLSSIKHPIKGDGRYGESLVLRANRPLLHAYQFTIDQKLFEAPPPPDFQYYLTPELRKNHLPFHPMDIRKDLQSDPNTTAYRVIHGKNDGFDGMTIDRYDEYLWIEVQNKEAFEQHLKNPIIHDLIDQSKGTYLLESEVNRSAGEQKQTTLFKGEPAPKPLKVWEGGVAYLVELSDSLSTGLFLDQRPQRMWLKENAKNWRILNTFCHAGGFSIAAACAGAKTVNIDLSKKWLDRIFPQLEANGISTEGHFCYAGDVFDWLQRLSKKNEKFDCIILDPPSTSIGTTKKRWSAQKDYGELVSLALKLLNDQGRLLCATNHRQINPYQFCQMIEAVIPENIKLERVCPPSIDYPTMGFVDVKNFIWKSTSSRP